MNLEKTFYRLFLFLALTSLIGFGFYSFYCQSKASDFEKLKLMDLSYEIKDQKECSNNPKSPLCESIQMWQEKFSEDSDMHYHYRSIAKTTMHAAYVVPLVLCLMFYSIRWILTGKLRPIFMSIK